MRPSAQSRAVAVLLVAAVALIAVGVWGVVKLGDGDWFIGGGFIACSVIGLGRVLSRIVRPARPR